MKKITLIIFTFSGIYTGFAQKPAEITDAGNVKKNTIANNLPVRNDTDSVTEKPSVKLFPNPARNKVEIEIKGFEPGNIRVQLTDNNGKLVIDDKRLVFSGNETIVLMFSEKPGLYFILLKQGKNSLRSKLVIQ